MYSYVHMYYCTSCIYSMCSYVYVHIYVYIGVYTPSSTNLQSYSTHTQWLYMYVQYMSVYNYYISCVFSTLGVLTYRWKNKRSIQPISLLDLFQKSRGVKKNPRSLTEPQTTALTFTQILNHCSSSPSLSFLPFSSTKSLTHSTVLLFSSERLISSPDLPAR